MKSQRVRVRIEIMTDEELQDEAQRQRARHTTAGREHADELVRYVRERHERGSVVWQHEHDKLDECVRDLRNQGVPLDDPLLRERVRQWRARHETPTTGPRESPAA